MENTYYRNLLIARCVLGYPVRSRNSYTDRSSIVRVSLQMAETRIQAIQRDGKLILLWFN